MSQTMFLTGSLLRLTFTSPLPHELLHQTALSAQSPALFVSLSLSFCLFISSLHPSEGVTAVPDRQTLRFTRHRLGKFHPAQKQMQVEGKKCTCCLFEALMTQSSCHGSRKQKLQNVFLCNTFSFFLDNCDL